MIDVVIEGTHLDMIWGLMVGFFMGIIILFWIKEQGLFTRRQQMGIIVGMLLNISFGILVRLRFAIPLILFSHICFFN